VNSDWNGLVKVTLVGDAGFKTYKRNQLELGVSILQKFKIGDMVKIVKYGSKMGRIARVEDPFWNDLVKVILLGDTAFKSYHRYEVESASDDDVAGGAKATLATTAKQSEKIELSDRLTLMDLERTLDQHSPCDVDTQHQLSTPLSSITCSIERRAAKKCLEQIKEKEGCDDRDVSSTIGVEPLEKVSDDFAHGAHHVANESNIASLPAGSISECTSISQSQKIGIAHQEALVKFFFV
jgi:hypothetical protein